ncbi:16S rRNA (guanine(527)-N(7))-methyltransferase RsmG [Sphingomicrobium sp. XHP0239]|uniref:16S rRNA (guanine(527)-N(7))-methyltransferase RsmG n=1 Tax=Sphingomicrobium maritimum TaxID=3133972 RepID=UPI0031CC5FB1
MDRLQADVSRETKDLLYKFVDAVLEENGKQNLISKQSESDIWDRHIADSIQLIEHAPAGAQTWVDIGAGPGLPGIVLTIVRPEHHFTLVEPRPLRTAFLHDMVKRLRLANIRIVESKAEALSGSYDIITGRAVAPLSKFLALSHHLSTEKTRWVLPKGRKAMRELEEARRLWHLDVTVAPSVTDEEARILLIDRAKRKGRA